MPTSHRAPSARPPVRLYEPIPDDRDAFWRQLRQTYGEVAPVYLEPGVPAWLLLSYEVNYRVMSDNATYRCDRDYWHDLAKGVIPADSGVRAINEKRESVLYVDGEEHRFLSEGMQKAFSALDERRVIGQIQEVAEDLVDSFCERGRADLIGEYARLLPLHVLGRLLNLGPEDVNELATSMGKLWGGGADSPEGARELKVLLTQLARSRRAAPGEDLPSYLIANGQSDSQVCDQLTLIVAGTNDLVTNSIGASLRRLLMDQWLASHHTGSQMLISETVNYVLLHSTPMEVLVGRFPTRDVRLGDYHIKAGDCLLLGFAAANTDLLDRTPHAQTAFTRAHLTFGTGAHRCPRYGRDLGQSMAEIALSTITSRLPDLRLAEPPERHRWVPHVNVRALVDLPVLFTPAHPRSAPSPLRHRHSQPRNRPETPGPESRSEPTPWWRRFGLWG
ncbi:MULTISPECIES: cytochrome P450 [unclassified Nocardiopsis]|uniref:cytochrome P450 n=1 Tax=unclassified Nocardiopsis TaxID=2649073 RepID=UPI0033EFB8DB